MGLLSGSTSAYKSVDRTNFTASNGQTTFTVTQGYNVGDVDVYLNGVKLFEGDDYYATNGTTVVVNSACSAGDVIQVVSYNQFLTANSYTKSESDSRYMVASGSTPMTSYLRTPNYGVSSWSDTANASLEASVGAGTQGVGIKAWGRSVPTSGGELTYVTDTRGASGQHIFYGFNGTTLTKNLSIDSLGRVSIPNQPLVVLQQTQTASGPQSTAAKCTSFSVIQNIGGHWNTTNNRFTSPISGVYQFIVQGIKYPQTGALHIDLYKNGVLNSQYRARAEEASGYNQYGVCYYVQANAGDYFEWFYFGDAGLHGDHGTWSIRLAQ